MTQPNLFPEFPVVDALKSATNAEKVGFDGVDYSAKRDQVRLSAQLLRIFNLMRDGQWRALKSIASKTRDSEASISAQLRNLRKKKFGAHTVNRRYLGDGLYEYQVIRNTKGQYND